MYPTADYLQLEALVSGFAQFLLRYMALSGLVSPIRKRDFAQRRKVRKDLRSDFFSLPVNVVVPALTPERYNRPAYNGVKDLYPKS